MVGGMTQTQLQPPAPITPQQYGVGARFTLSVYDSDYVNVILGALKAADATGLIVETDDVSTFIGGAESDILRYLRDTIASAANSGAHISASILLSRGCPGELQCELPPGVPAIGAEPVRLTPTGVRAAAHWSLYPLLDTRSNNEDHMTAIYAAIEQAKQAGIYTASHHYATRLDADLAEILETAANAWIEVGRTVQHVTTHLTISINSPTNSTK